MPVVHLCRHAKAADGDPDELRALTPGGVDQARTLGRQLADAPEPPVVVLASPLVRARQTAEILAREVGAELRGEPLLAPGATVDHLRRAVRGLGGPVATVGHQPDCSEIALAVNGDDPGFPPAGTTRLELGSG
jgi:phosphohistidine phosphatase